MAAASDRVWLRLRVPVLEGDASVVMELADQFWGDRYGQIRDPFGHVWSIGAPSQQG